MESKEVPQYSIEEIDTNDQKTLSQIETIEDEILDRQGTAVLWVDSPAFTLGAKQGDQIIGMTQVDVDGHVNTIIHPDYQRQGIARSLLHKSISMAPEFGITKLIATVENGSASEKMIIKEGFNKIDEEGDHSIYHFSVAK